MRSIVPTAVRLDGAAIRAAARALVVAARIGPALPRTVGRAGSRASRSRPLPGPAQLRIWPAPGAAAVPAGRAAFPFAVREVRALLVSHVPHADRHGDENDHDNGRQSDHERSHHTIQQAMTSRTAQARHARGHRRGPSPVVLTPWMNSRLVTRTLILSDRYGPCHALREV
jgi:hypothetical protein